MFLASTNTAAADQFAEPVLVAISSKAAECRQ
jgi:hypothetical protein